MTINELIETLQKKVDADADLGFADVEWDHGVLVDDADLEWEHFDVSGAGVDEGDPARFTSILRLVP